MSNCNCTDYHPQNASRAGAPISMWKCEKHGNVFDDGIPAPIPVTLTKMQLEILEFIQRRHLIGQPAGIEEVSDHFGYGHGSVRVQMNVLQSLNLIERS